MKAKKVTKRELLNIPYCSEHTIWMQMWQRCINPETKRFSDYGGRGIKVDERWRDFFQFIADMGRRPSLDHSIDRKDVNGHYSPENCKWSTRAEQAANKRNSVLITYHGRTQTITAWSRELGVSRAKIEDRFTECMDWEQVIDTIHEDRNEQRKIRITINGETRTLAGWCKINQVPPKVAWQRMKRDGMTPEEAVTIPATKSRAGIVHGIKEMRSARESVQA
jgi:hypothetical protein